MLFFRFSENAVVCLFSFLEEAIPHSPSSTTTTSTDTCCSSILFCPSIVELEICIPKIRTKSSHRPDPTLLLLASQSITAVVT